MFANSTCFDEELMGKLAQGAAALKEGAILVTQTDAVPSSAFEIVEEVDVFFSRIFYIYSSSLKILQHERFSARFTFNVHVCLQVSQVSVEMLMARDSRRIFCACKCRPYRSVTSTVARTRWRGAAGL